MLVDEGVLYFDARLSHRYPTVEIRNADVCLDARDTVLIAELSRGLVETASRAWQSGEPPSDESAAIVRLSMWQAGRTGVEGTLLDPVACQPRPVRDVVDELVDHIGPALRGNGDDKLVKHRLAEIWDRGTGASRQTTRARSHRPAQGCRGRPGQSHRGTGRVSYPSMPVVA